MALAAEDSVEVDGRKQDPARYGAFFDNLRRMLEVELFPELWRLRTEL